MAGTNGTANGEQRVTPFRRGEREKHLELLAKHVLALDDIDAKKKKSKDAIDRIKADLRAGGFVGIEDQGQLTTTRRAQKPDLDPCRHPRAAAREGRLRIATATAEARPPSSCLTAACRRTTSTRRSRSSVACCSTARRLCASWRTSAARPTSTATSTARSSRRCSRCSRTASRSTASRSPTAWRPAATWRRRRRRLPRAARQGRPHRGEPRLLREDHPRQGARAPDDRDGQHHRAARL
jgi:hypothetical protein